MRGRTRIPSPTVEVSSKTASARPCKLMALDPSIRFSLVFLEQAHRGPLACLSQRDRCPSLFGSRLSVGFGGPSEPLAPTPCSDTTSVEVTQGMGEAILMFEE